MSWKKFLFPMLLLLVVSGCQKQSSPTQKALDFRTALMEAGGCSYTAVIGADYGERAYSFSVACTYDTDGTAKMTVLQPEEIAGITAAVSGDGAVVEFQDVALDFGVMADGTVSPMEVCHLLGRCWTGAYIASAGSDGDLERISYLHGYEAEELAVDTWLNAEGAPVYAEVMFENVRCLSVQLTEFRFEEEL